MIGSAAVGALKQLSATDRAKITNLTVKELDTANSVMFAAGQVWDRIVGGHVASAADAKTSLAALLTKSRLYEDDDLTRMFAFRDFKDAVKAVDADLVDRRKDLTALSDEDLLKHATAGEQPKPGKSLEAGKRPKLIDKIAKREEFSAIAGSDGAKTLGLSANDAETYYHGGAVDIFGEDRAAWQRLAIERPPVKGGTDDLGARIRAAAEAGGGFRLARLNMHAALSKFIADNPLATEDDVARAAAFHNFGSSGSKSAKVYAERISGLFGPIRQARLGGHPVIRAADTDPDGPAAKPKPIPAAPGPAIISRTARGQRPAAAAPAREALASAVLARKRVLARQEKPAPAGDLTEEQALAALAKLSLVMSPSHGAPLSTADQKHHFLRAGKDFFGSFQATLDWFGAIRAVKVPGGVVMHDSAATRLEAVAAVMGTDMPATGGGFELRRPFTEASHFSRLSHHTLGLAVDYDTTDMIRIGSRRIEDGQETSHTADFLEAVTGESTHLDLEPERTLGVSRRQLIKRMGEATAAGKSAADIAGAGDLLQSIADETDRVSQASDDFKDSLGDGHDAFLALRVEYLKPKADRTAVMAKVAPLVKPWITALDDAEKEFHTTAEGCGFDPGKLPSRAAVQAKITERRAIASAAAAMAKRYPAKDGAEPTLSSADQVKLEGWEQTLRLKPGSTTPAKRLDAVEEEALDLDDLQTLTSAESKVKHYADLRTMLVSDGTFLFGTSIRKVADTPSLAQMLESGFFNPGKPGPGAEDRGNFDAKFISEMAKHGFDAGAAWGGAVTDAMHFEQLGPIAKLVD
jgi:hypothetical protein